MRRSMMFMALLLPMTLTGCGGDKEGTTISFNAIDSDGNVTAGVDGNSGEVAINAPGFSGKFTLPKLQLGAGDFELNGVKLYPGSTIKSMNIVANAGKDDTGGGENDKGNGSVRITFDSPATPEKVRDYFADKLGKADFTLTQQGLGLKGTDDEKKPFALDLKPAANGHSTGVIVAGG